MGIGLIRAGWLGGLVAWVGFTLPSEVLMVLAAGLLSAQPAWLAGGWVDGLLVAAVAQSVLLLQQKLASDCERASLMALSAVLVLLVPHAWAQLLSLLLGGIVGLLALTPPDHEPLQSTSLRRQALEVMLTNFVEMALVVENEIIKPMAYSWAFSFDKFKN